MLVKELQKLRNALGADAVVVMLIKNELDVTAVKDVADLVAQKAAKFDVDALSMHDTPVVDLIALEFVDFVSVEEVHHG